jgi:hypothetical protein
VVNNDVTSALTLNSASGVFRQIESDIYGIRGRREHGFAFPVVGTARKCWSVTLGCERNVDNSVNKCQPCCELMVRLRAVFQHAIKGSRITRGARVVQLKEAVGELDGNWQVNPIEQVRANLSLEAGEVSGQ